MVIRTASGSVPAVRAATEDEIKEYRNYQREMINKVAERRLIILIPKRNIREQIHVKVSSEFDKTGYMQPTAITWDDSQVFKIETVRDFRPAGTVGLNFPGDCYTVVINGLEKHLFFEHSDPLFKSRIGRWFVERTAAG